MFQAKSSALRSQFACTYRDEELPLNRVLDFPSSSQVPTCVHPAPKPKAGVDEPSSRGSEEPDAGTVRGGLCVPRRTASTAPNVNTSRAALRPCWDKISVSSDATRLERGPGHASLSSDLEPFPVLALGPSACHQPLNESPRSIKPGSRPHLL